MSSDATSISWLACFMSPQINSFSAIFGFLQHAEHGSSPALVIFFCVGVHMPTADKSSLRTKTALTHAFILQCQVSSDRLIIAVLFLWGNTPKLLS